MDKEQLLKLCGENKALAKSVIKELKKAGNLNELLPKWENQVWTMVQREEDNGNKCSTEDVAKVAAEIVSKVGEDKKEKPKEKATQKKTPKKQLREKILLFGDTSTGKSFTILKIAERIQKDGGKLYVIDTDDGLEKSLHYEFPHLDNVENHLATNFDEIIEDFEDIKKKVTKKDWVAFEMLAAFWTCAQDDYAGKVYGENMEELYQEQRRRLVLAGKTGAPATGVNPMLDWPAIKKKHNRLLDYLTKRMKCNVIATTNRKKLMDFNKGGQEMEDEETMDTFGDIGFKPDGEKNNQFRFDTILYLSKSRVNGKETFYVESPKNRGMKAFGKKKVINDSVYETYLKYSGS